MSRSIAYIVLALVLLPRFAGAQCSDAGACSIGTMGGDHAEEGTRHQIALRYVFGSSGSPDDLTFHTLQAEGSIEVIAGSRLAIRVPYHSIDGPLGSTSGIGDLILLWDQRLWEHDDMALRAQGGAKLATGDDNANGLPQAYQPGLGTSDFIAGLSFDAAPWSAAVAWQFSDGRSGNSIDRLQRGDDLVLRAGYRTVIDVFGLGLDVIAVKRLEKSSVHNPPLPPAEPGPESFVDLPGSDQFQVNLLGSVSAPLSDNLRLSLQAAMPLLQRDVNVDGLKRALTVGLGVEWGF
ncbi:MAG: hypothetical protein KFF77_06755 [Bacteroidetes bacterium]|nr:hypothetical protein [Bacteroidota bacterium]